MEIEWGSVARFVAGLVPAVVAGISLLTGPGALRKRLKHDSEVLEKLPKDSKAHQDLLEVISTQVLRVARLETQSSRDTGPFVGALVTAPVAVWGTYKLATLDTWWSWVLCFGSGVLAIALLVGIVEAGQKVPRDKDGKRI